MWVCACELEDSRCILAALYLPGLGFPCLPKPGWRSLRDFLRRECPSLERAEASLRSGGYRDAAALLSSPRRLASAEGKGILTALDDAYPVRWEQVLGDAAPPALWRSGEVPETRWLGMAGGRRVDASALERARAAAQSAVAAGFGAVSGAAEGCDSAAAEGSFGGRLLEILPRGLEARETWPEPGRARLSLRPPGEPFSAAAAMERNRLIYAASHGTYVAQARLREGGSWHGAAEALRLRLCPVAVPDDGQPAHRVLASLGAITVVEPGEFATAVRRGLPALF